MEITQNLTNRIIGFSDAISVYIYKENETTILFLFINLFICLFTLFIWERILLSIFLVFNSHSFV